MTSPEPPRRIQVSLRTFLIAVLAAGLTLGILGQLCRSRPEMFLIILSALSTIVPFLLAIATVLWIGYHRSPLWSLPMCAACQCDLRWLDLNGVSTCPQCEADLSKAKALAFVRKRHRSGAMILWGMVLLLMPAIGLSGMVLFRVAAGPSNRGFGLLSNREIIDRHLLAQVDQPPIWRELEQRLAAGQLSQKEVDDAVKILVRHMKSTRPTGWDQPFHWQDGFLQAASSAGLISDSVLLDLCDAFYGTKAKIEPLSRVREDGRNLRLRVAYGSTWDNHFGGGVKLIWEVAAVRLDDKRLDVRRVGKSNHDWSGIFDGLLPAGEHELSAEIECAYVDTDLLAGLNIGELPARSWPEARKRWKQTVSAKCKVYTKDEPMLRLVSDFDRDPTRTGSLGINRFVVQDDRSDKRRICLSIDFNENLAVPVSFDVEVRLADETIPLRHMFAARGPGWSTSSGSQLETRIDAVDPSLRDADIILTPNPEHIEWHPQVEEIWGEKIVLSRVPLERFDLEPQEAETLDETTQAAARSSEVSPEKGD